MAQRTNSAVQSSAAVDADTAASPNTLGMHSLIAELSIAVVSESAAHETIRTLCTLARLLIKQYLSLSHFFVRLPISLKACTKNLETC